MQGISAKILVVDDERTIRNLIETVLSESGHSVVCAEDGLQAIELLRRDRDFQLLLTDIALPGVDGIAVIREARRICPAIIPLVMTGHGSLETARAALKEGAADYVEKPFSVREIRHAVLTALERHHLAAENSRLRELTELFQVSEAIATIRDEQKLLDFVLRAALTSVGAERGSLMVMTPDGGALEVASSVGLPEEACDRRVKLGEGIAGWVAEHGLPLCIDNIDHDPELVSMSRQLADASFASVPLERKLASTSGLRHRPRNVHGNARVLAVLNVNRKKSGGNFTKSDLKILNIMANHASVALENVRLIRDIEQAHLATLQSMALVLEAKDPYTHGHSQRVRNYSVAAARKLGMSEQDVETLRLGAMLHDVGKIGVADTVLNNPSRLGEHDWRQIKQHPVIGYEVLEPVSFLTEDHLSLVRWHHERLDGSGYPDGLCGDDLDDIVRVIAAADTYDAMSGDRAYRRGLPRRQIVEEFRACAGKQLDRKVSSLFVDMIESGEIARYAVQEPRACA